jgi:hypothetical protein
MLTVGSALGEEPALGVRPCGGELSVPVTSASYQDDGRLLALMAVDPSGAFDVALKAHEGEPADLTGSFSGSIIWSDGTLAGKLPLVLTIGADQSVTVSSTRSDPPAAACDPAY